MPFTAPFCQNVLIPQKMLGTKEITVE